MLQQLIIIIIDPFIPKIFEKIVCNKILAITNKNLSNFLHGFRPGLSTTTNLAVFCNFVNININSNLQTDVIYTDFSKAFDNFFNSMSTLFPIGAQITYGPRPVL